ncbi:MAG: hypothetical protein B7W98_01610, partial [Parcubacteria group bacterium 20-58-5]
DTNLATTQKSAGTQTSQIDQQIADNSAAETQAANDAYNKLNAISSGTYPLSPAEQQLLDSTKASFAQALQAHQTANAGALGQMREFHGLQDWFSYRPAPEEHPPGLQGELQVREPGMREEGEADAATDTPIPVFIPNDFAAPTERTKHVLAEQRAPQKPAYLCF